MNILSIDGGHVLSRIVSGWMESMGDLRAERVARAHISRPLPPAPVAVVEAREEDPERWDGLA